MWQSHSIAVLRDEHNDQTEQQLEPCHFQVLHLRFFLGVLSWLRLQSSNQYGGTSGNNERTETHQATNSLFRTQDKSRLFFRPFRFHLRKIGTLTLAWPGGEFMIIMVSPPATITPIIYAQHSIPGLWAGHPLYRQSLVQTSRIPAHSSTGLNWWSADVLHDCRCRGYSGMSCMPP